MHYLRRLRFGQSGHGRESSESGSPNGQLDSQSSAQNRGDSRSERPFPTSLTGTHKLCAGGGFRTTAPPWGMFSRSRRAAGGVQDVDAGQDKRRAGATGRTAAAGGRLPTRRAWMLLVANEIRSSSPAYFSGSKFRRGGVVEAQHRLPHVATAAAAPRNRGRSAARRHLGIGPMANVTPNPHNRGVPGARRACSCGHRRGAEVPPAG